jgi:tetratricopeptide (TPR) repeat protein
MMLGAIVAKMGAGIKAPQDAPAATAPAIVAQQRQRPNEAIFNTQFTTAGKRFLHKIKKNRAMQVDRRTRGFQLGLEQRTVVIDPFTGSHYRVMTVDPDMLRRENLADDLEQRFEILVAPSNERAFALLGLFEVNFVLLRLDIGNDQTAATSPALAFLREMKRSCFRTPVAALVDPSFNTNHEAQKLLARALQQGGVCGYFEEGLPPDILTERIAKLLRSVSIAQNELARCRGTQAQPSPDQNTGKAPTRVQPQASPPQLQQLDNQIVNRARVTPPSSATGPKRLPSTDVPSTRPSSVKFDRPGMLLELSLNQRKQCLRQREALQATFASAPHSVLGVDIDSNPMSGKPATPSATCLSPLSPSCGSPGRQTKVKKKTPPLPSPKQVSHLIYTRPQELQTRIGRHMYERLHIAGPPGAVPQDPLLNHCVVIDPRPQGRDLLVGKAYMLYCEQRLDEALLHCNRALRTPNQTLEKLARLLRGALYDARGEHGRAEAEFLACLQLDPSMHEAHFNLSVARLKLGKDALALQALTQALTLDPQNDKYLHNRGLMYRRMGHFVQAQSEYCKREISSSASPGPRSAQISSRRGFSKASIDSGSIVTPPATRSVQLTRGKLSKCEMEDGMFAHLFGKPTPDKLALACPATERSADMLSAIVARLQTLLFFQDFSREMLTTVAQTLDYDVVACGKSFTLGETHAQNFYVLLGGRLSIRRRVGTTDFASTVTTHHLGAGSVFGCAGFTVSAQASLIADECAEIGILWPDAYTATIQAVTSQTNHDVFAFLQQLRGFRRLTTSELGHVVGISERKRFRKGDVLLEQNEQPRHLFVLWKGSCSVYQDFDSAPLSRRKLRRSAEFDGWSDEEEEEEDSDESDEDNVESHDRRARRHACHGDNDDEAATPPFHRLIAKPDWPLGFQARTRARKYRRGRRHGLMLSRTPPVMGALSTAPPLTMSLPMRRVKEKLSTHDKNALVQKCVAPAVFGESRFLDPTHAPSKCCVVAESLVEVLLFDHMRLQEMDLQPEVISELFDAAPKYLSEKEVAQKQADVVGLLYVRVCSSAIDVRTISAARAGHVGRVQEPARTGAVQEPLARSQGRCRSS